MKSIGTLALIGLIGSAAAACKDDTTGTSIPDIVGSWHATTAVVTNVATPAVSVNLIALGATLQITFTASLNYTSTINLPGQQAEVSTGTYVETATQLALHDGQNPSNVVTFSLASSGGTLTLSGGTPFTFDFGAGEVPARLDVTLVH